MIQSKEELDEWYSKEDPWEYRDNPQDALRRTRILASIPPIDYINVLDIGSGNGFLSNDLPGKNIIGIDISDKAVNWANKNSPSNVRYITGSIFNLSELVLPTMDLVVITGVLYPQYIGASLRLIYILVDQVLKKGGILVCSHVYEWYSARFPYLTVSREYFAYREYTQILEVYCK